MGKTKLEWRVPFGSEHANRGDPQIAHLIDMGAWVSRRLCMGGIVNARLATEPKPGVRHCVNCKRLQAGQQQKAARYPERRRPGVRAAA